MRSLSRMHLQLVSRVAEAGSDAAGTGKAEQAAAEHLNQRRAAVLKEVVVVLKLLGDMSDECTR